MTAIELNHIVKQFRVYTSRNDRWIRREVLNALKRNNRRNDYWTVLQDVDLRIGKGEIVGLIGRNGSGKSTLLRLITGILQPTSGTIEINGSMCALLELGAGFSPDLTVEENVFLYGTILGLQEKRIRQLLPEIISFSELDSFLDTPIKHCSSGMQARLGFAVATSADPDIFLLDEILAVGDQGFRQKCEDKLQELFDGNKTIVMVSHDLDSIRKVCTRAIWLDSGRIQADGRPDAVISRYEAIFNPALAEAS